MTTISALINAVSTTLSQDGTTSTGVGVSLLKKAITTDRQNVQQLLASVAPTPAPAPATRNPAHLGNNVDTTA